MTLLVLAAKVALVAFLVGATATFVVTYARRRRRREPLPPWTPAGTHHGYAPTPLPPWVDEYGNIVEPDDKPTDPD